MAQQINVTQLRRVVFIKYDPVTKTNSVPLVLEPDDLGEDPVLTLNVAPRTKSRTSSLGTTETPMVGTFDALSASITMLMDTYRPIGLALNRWNAATYEGASPNAGNIVFGGGDDSLCEGGEYMRVVVQGVCDNGSSTDVDITRCIPSITDDIEFNTQDTPTVTLNLNPIIYNARTHEGDGFPDYTVKMGDNELTKMMRLNVTTGEYQEVTAAEPGA